MSESPLRDAPYRAFRALPAARDVRALRIANVARKGPQGIDAPRARSAPAQGCARADRLAYTTRVDNLDAIARWTSFATKNCAGDVTPADGPNVDFWFASRSLAANAHFLCFGCGGDGSLLAIQATDGGFEKGPVVHLGHEGEVFVIADDVPHALALIAASGDNYEGMIYALTYGEAEPVGADAGLAAFVKAQFDVEVPVDAIAAIKATDARLGEATRALIERLNAG